MIYEIWHYSRIQISLAAAALTAASSQVLTHEIKWNTVAAVALATTAVYWIDDLLDHRSDESHSPALAGMWRARKYGIGAALPVVCFGCLVLSFRGGRNFVFLLALLAFGTLGFFLVSAWLTRSDPLPASWPLARGIAVSFVWSSLCILGPVLSAHASLRLQDFMAAAFVWMLMMVVGTMWAAGEHATKRVRIAEGPEHIFELAGIENGVAVLQVICACSALMTIGGIILKYFPWQNISVISASLVNGFFLGLWNRIPHLERRVLNEYMILSNILCCVLVIGAYTTTTKIEEVGPKDFFDWFQFISLIVLLATIGGKSLLLCWRDNISPIHLSGEGAGGHLEFLLVWGFAIFIFQVFLSVFHLSTWLFPVLHGQLYHSTFAALAGVVLIVGSLLLFAAGYSAMGNSWRIGIDHTGPGVLVTTGIFAFTRNPIYISVNLYMFATFLIAPSWMFLIFALLTPIFLHLQIVREETFLTTSYGSAYSDYCTGSPRYVSLWRDNAH